MATIKKLDKNKWEVRYDSYDQQGKRHQRRKTFPRAADAKAFVASLDPAAPYEAAHMTFDRFVDEWFAAQRPRFEAETVRTYQYVISRSKEAFGSMRLSDITPSRLEAFFASVASLTSPKTGQPMSPNTLKLYRAVLSRIFKYAVRDRYIADNPLSRVELPSGAHRELAIPDIDELKKRMAALKGTPTYLPVCIAVFTGMRRGEVLGLRWDCVDLDKRIIHVRRVRIHIAPGTSGRNDTPLALPGLSNYISRDYTKTKQQRSVTIPHSLVTLLRAQRAAQAEAQLRLGAAYFKTDFVCTTPDGVPLSAESLTRSLKGFCRFHDLRHLNASLLLDEGYSVAAVADRIGHASPSTTLNVYAHALRERDLQAADSIDRRLQIKT